MDHGHMDHGHMDHGDHGMPGMGGDGPTCNMNVRMRRNGTLIMTLWRLWPLRNVAVLTTSV